MNEAMEKANLPLPKISVSGLNSFFTIVFTRLDTPQDTPQVKLTELEDKIIAEIKINPRISRNALALKIGISSDTVKEYLEKLKIKKAIKRVGKTSAGYWEIIR